MHILLIHQAFASLDEPGGTRHHELALHLAEHGHRVTVIASPVSYLTGKATSPPNPLSQSGEGELPSPRGRGAGGEGGKIHSLLPGMSVSNTGVPLARDSRREIEVPSLWEVEI